MKKYLLIIALAILIAGCDGKQRRDIEMAKDEAACHNHSGVQIYSNFAFNATCKDGTKVESYNQTGPLVAEYLKKIQSNEK